ncbi:MAG: hypothetical protein CMJ84_16570 [Planctomycetes bacterium]|jgi:TPR repeat protein|nr:hypothetical protein [Planctomycetota bacterium]MDP6409942.1 tetratricopeptide repeat protein [Planctomycetota bacterium]
MRITAILLGLGSLLGCAASDTIEKRAARGDLEAQATLGSMYASGEGAPEDDEEAVRWFRMAADQGLARAQFHLACMYCGGTGVPKDGDEVRRWMRLAAEQGLAEAAEAGRRFSELLETAELQPGYWRRLPQAGSMTRI